MNDSPIHSPEQSIRAESGAHQQVVKNEWPPVPGWIPVVAIIACVLMAISICATVALYEEYHTVRKANWLDQYSISQLKSGQIARLSAQQQVNQKLIEAYGISKLCRNRK